MTSLCYTTTKLYIDSCSTVRKNSLSHSTWNVDISHCTVSYSTTLILYSILYSTIQYRSTHVDVFYYSPFKVKLTRPEFYRLNNFPILFF